MEAVELRTLDGPNLFMSGPAIKLEIVAEPDERPSGQAGRFLGNSDPGQNVGPMAIAGALRDVLRAIHARLELDEVDIVIRMLEEQGHAAVAYEWSRRSVSRAIGDLSWRIVSGDAVEIERELALIHELLARSAVPDDAPEMLAEPDRNIPVIAITGTNGKTTTTRLVASMLRRAGRKVGWTSSSGVMIDTEMVLAGDYTGPSGALRVFQEPGVDVAVLETARGGILMRGLGYEHNDVSVVTNISADHMGMHGVHSLEVLADVKSVVARVTLPGGHAVLNADDARVLRIRDVIVARPFLFSRSDENRDVDAHIHAGGWALRANEGSITWYHNGAAEQVARLQDIPITFAGRAGHMVENALAGAAAGLAIGLSVEHVRDGLKAFRNRTDENRGRLNVFDHEGAIVVIDFAHNEAGLEHLLAFGRSYGEESGRLIAVIGTAGDREDRAIEGIGRIAAARADAVLVKDSEKYLRGRDAGEMPAMLERAAADRVAGVFSNERSAFYAGLDMVEPGDVLAVMCIEDSDEILGFLEDHATPLS